VLEQDLSNALLVKEPAKAVHSNVFFAMAKDSVNVLPATEQAKSKSKSEKLLL
jgi:hypothetical protein